MRVYESMSARCRWCWAASGRRLLSAEEAGGSLPPPWAADLIRQEQCPKGESPVVRNMSLKEQVDRDFTHARRRALLRRMRARLRKDLTCNRLLSFDDVKGSLGASNQLYLGMRVEPVEKIVGSVDRYEDFDRSFLPTKASVEAKWKRIDRAFHRSEELPPVILYKIGEKYFVLDGNHRVSVARYQGTEMIDAEVIEIRPRMPIGQILELECKEM